MRRYLLLFSIFFLIPINCFAVVNTKTRTKDNLLIPKDVVVDNNLNDILNTPAVSSNEKIYDFIDLFSASDKEKLIKKIKHYKKNTGMDSVIVTTNNLNGFSLSNYAYHFYDYNDFSNNGIILVIYVDEIEPRIFMGNMSGDSSIYNDKRIEQTLSYVYKNIRKENYYQAVSDYLEIVDGFYVHNSYYYLDKDGNFILLIPWFELIVLSFSLTFIIDFLLLSFFKKKKEELNSDFLDYSLDSSSLTVKMLSDEKITDDISV